MAPSVLLVDADANFRRALRVALTLEGIRVGEAASLDEARRAFASQRWHCAVVDLLLPCAEGSRVVELVGRQGDVGLIACSSHGELLASVPDRALRLEKPFTPAMLLAHAAPFFDSFDSNSEQVRRA